MSDTSIQELQNEIDKIDFDGGMTTDPAPTPESEPVTPAAEDPSPTPEPKSGDEPQATDEPAGAVTEPVVPAAEDPSPTPEAGTETPAAAIPDSHYRAARYFDITPEQIADMMDTAPEASLKIFAKLHETCNASSQQLSALGRHVKELQATPAPAVTRPVENPFVTKLRERYVDDPIVDLVEELLAGKTAQPQPQPQPQSVLPERSTEDVIAIRQQINTFFTADDMNAYDDFYGKTGQAEGWDNLTPGQRANRMAVCDNAQLMLDGAAMAGMRLSVPDALERAHLGVTAPIAAQVVRERLVSNVTKRAKGVTLKPSGSKTQGLAGQTKAQAIEEVGAMFKDIFG